MATRHLQELIKELRQRIEDDHVDFHEQYGKEQVFKYIDSFIASSDRSDLEKAFFLILHQYPGDRKNYIVCPSEMVFTTLYYFTILTS